MPRRLFSVDTPQNCPNRTNRCGRLTLAPRFSLWLTVAARCRSGSPMRPPLSAADVRRTCRFARSLMRRHQRGTTTQRTNTTIAPQQHAQGHAAPEVRRQRIRASQARRPTTAAHQRPSARRQVCWCHHRSAGHPVSGGVVQFVNRRVNDVVLLGRLQHASHLYRLTSFGMRRGRPSAVRRCGGGNDHDGPGTSPCLQRIEGCGQVTAGRGPVQGDHVDQFGHGWVAGRRGIGPTDGDRDCRSEPCRLAAA